VTVTNSNKKVVISTNSTTDLDRYEYWLYEGTKQIGGKTIYDQNNFLETFYLDTRATYRFVIESYDWKNPQQLFGFKEIYFKINYPHCIVNVNGVMKFCMDPYSTNNSCVTCIDPLTYNWIPDATAVIQPNCAMKMGSTFMAIPNGKCYIPGTNKLQDYLSSHIPPGVAH